MPKKIHDCAKEVMAQGKSESSAWAICNAAIKGDGKKHPKGKK